jgi:hypothetical protein
MINRDLQTHARLEPAAKALLDQVAEKFGLSARAYLRSVKVAHTIADLRPLSPCNMSLKPSSTAPMPTATSKALARIHALRGAAHARAV